MYQSIVVIIAHGLTVVQEVSEFYIVSQQGYTNKGTIDMSIGRNFNDTKSHTGVNRKTLTTL